MRNATLCFLIRGDEVLLAMKKRGFGVGKWNGVGGKVGADESIEQATIRETKEEIGVEINSTNLIKMAEITFNFVDPAKRDWNQVVHVFFATKWAGQPTESEEMAPQWYVKTDLPFASMWIDDPLWLPLTLEGKKLKAEFLFSGDGEGSKIEDSKVEEVERF